MDDVAGFGHPSTVHADQAHARTTITTILGPKGLADKSLLPCPAGEILGWYVDLPRLTLLPSAKGCRKLLWTFFTLDVTARKWPLRQCQLLASLAQRYHVAIQGMAPYVYPFEALLAGTSPGARKVTSAARQAAEMWRAAAVLLIICPAALAMPIPRFLRLPTCPDTTLIEAHTDAGPTHLGLKLIDPLTKTVHLHTSFALPFSTPAAGCEHQNNREFLGCLLAMLCASRFRARCGVPPTHTIAIAWVGDNTSALSWAQQNKCRSASAQRAFVAYTMAQLTGGVVCSGTQHMAGVDMGDIDRLSRQRAVLDLDPAFLALFRTLDPAVPNNHTRPHHGTLVETHALLAVALRPE